MTNRELQEELKKFPDDADMWIEIVVHCQSTNSVDFLRSASILTHLTLRQDLNQLTLESKVQ